MSDDLENCDYCGGPIGFYGCRKHGTDCYDPDLHPEWDDDEPGAVST